MKILSTAVTQGHVLSSFFPPFVSLVLFKFCLVIYLGGREMILNNAVRGLFNLGLFSAIERPCSFNIRETQGVRTSEAQEQHWIQCVFSAVFES